MRCFQTWGGGCSGCLGGGSVRGSRAWASSCPGGRSRGRQHAPSCGPGSNPGGCLSSAPAQRLWREGGWGGYGFGSGARRFGNFLGPVRAAAPPAWLTPASAHHAWLGPGLAAVSSQGMRCCSAANEVIHLIKVNRARSTSCQEQCCLLSPRPPDRDLNCPCRSLALAPLRCLCAGSRKSESGRCPRPPSEGLAGPPGAGTGEAPAVLSSGHGSVRPVQCPLQSDSRRGELGLHPIRSPPAASVPVTSMHGFKQIHVPSKCA